MAASDAMPVPRKNTAFRLYFDLRNSSSALVTTWAGADTERSIDGAAFADCTNEATEIGTSGVGYIDLTAAEMNGDSVIVKTTVTNTGAITAVFYLYPQEAGDIRVNTTYWFDAALTATYVIPPTAAEVATAVAAPSATVIADAVWDEQLSGHVTAGSAGAALTASGSASDPLTNPVPGSYAAGTAGAQIALIGTAQGSVQSPVTAVSAVTLFAGSTYGATTQTVVFTSDSTMALTGTPKFEIPELGIVLNGVLTGSSGAWILTFSFTGAETATLQLGTRRYRVRVTLTGGNITPALVEGSVTVR